VDGESVARRHILAPDVLLAFVRQKKGEAITAEQDLGYMLKLPAPPPRKLTGVCAGCERRPPKSTFPQLNKRGKPNHASTKVSEDTPDHLAFSGRWGDFRIKFTE